jgi:exopolysaccharide biosynthesis polyprenyl glycosylphosphotransferase
VHIIGFLDPDDPDLFNRRRTDNVLGHVRDFARVLASNVVDEVVIAVPRSMLANLQAITDICEEEGIKLRFMADIYDFDAARIGLDMVDKVPLLSFEPVARDEHALLIKRFVDLTLTIVALPLLIPVFALVAAAIKLDSPGPAVFVQERVGLHKRRFRMYKFRSMVVDAEARMAEIEHLNEAEGPNFKIENDPRLTRVGRFIRKTSIDELPQLINVLVGDMSLVGPRPMSIRDVDLFDRGIQRKRFSVRPGLTCLWQISGRSNLSFDDWLRLDLRYISDWSLTLDLKILAMTVPSVIKGSGAA